MTSVEVLKDILEGVDCNIILIRQHNVDEYPDEYDVPSVTKSQYFISDITEYQKQEILRLLSEEFTLGNCVVYNYDLFIQINITWYSHFFPEVLPIMETPLPIEESVNWKKEGF